ncbi:hypothetical protein OG393_18740 [Streptomyces sp. NBC_01216]|uniref:hypothetical protein n=1 Tax=Streptomyces sp. NBC_01216 TaxID=2903778 RepID=UPI002E0EACB2|nr:hypothetical protein OG393_18740 [Streptomyces sp. NBC_01216]
MHGDSQRIGDERCSPLTEYLQGNVSNVMKPRISRIEILSGYLSEFGAKIGEVVITKCVVAKGVSVR